MTPTDLETVRLTEERLVNVWPAVSTMFMDGWIVRFANGYSGRANSASAVIPGSTMPDALIGYIEQLYREAGLVPTVRITPLASPDVEPMLLQRGYRARDDVFTMTAQLDSTQARLIDPNISMEPTPSPAWLAGVTSREQASKRSPDHLYAIVGQLRVASAFATARVANADIGFGMAAVDRGWAEIGSVLLDQNHRGKGLGRATVGALLNWACQQHAHHAFLQVEAKNIIARNLYRSLGFEDLCLYKTLIKV